MASLYVTKNGVSLGLKNNRIYISKEGEETKEIPIHKVDRILIFEGVKISSNLIQYAIENNIDITFLKGSGQYLGRISGGENDRVDIVRKQILLTGDDNFRIEMSKKIIDSKLNNQIILLNRRKKIDESIIKNIEQMKRMKNNINKCKSIEEIMGYEGISAKEYFEGISKTINKEFAFEGRSKRPPKDMFNAMISMAYTLLFSEINSIAASKGLYVYAGFMHSDKKGHPALISDFIEEWRPVICDSTVISIINKKWIKKEDFNFNNDGSVYLNQNGRKILVEHLTRKLNSEINYFDKKMSYRDALSRQVESFIDALKNEDTSLYKSSNIR